MKGLLDKRHKTRTQTKTIRMRWSELEPRLCCTSTDVVAYAFEGLFDNSPVALLVVDNKSGTLLKVNKVFEDITGYSKQEVIGKRIDAIIAPEDRERILDYRRRRLLGDPTVPRQYEMLIIGKSGEKKAVLLTVDLVPFTDVLLCSAVDLTEIKMSRGEVTTIARMDTMRSLAGAMGSQLNNLLTAIAGYTDLLERTQPDEISRRNALESIREAVAKGMELASTMCSFASAEHESFARFDLTRTVEKLCSALFSPKECILDSGLYLQRWTVKGDKRLLEHALAEILLNAKEAISSPQGRVWITVYDPTEDELSLAFENSFYLSSHPFIAIEIRDNGRGMDKQTLENMFQPFFTTKDTRFHTGLGLSFALRAIRELSGGVAVQSTAGRGTSFRIYLPKAESLGLPAKIVQKEKHKPTIAVVEDEDLVRMMLHDSLEIEGYEVVSMDSGQKLLEWLQNGNTISLALVDIMLPDMDGRDLVRKLRNRGYRIPIMLMSGSYWSEQSDAKLEQDLVGFLPKPFGAADVAQQIRSVLRKQNTDTKTN